MQTLERTNSIPSVISYRVGEYEGELLTSFAAFYGMKPNQLAKQALIEKLEDLEDITAAEKAQNSGSKSYSLEEVASEFGVIL